MYKVTSRARQTQYRSTSSDSKIAKYFVPYGRPPAIGELPMTEEPGRFTNTREFSDPTETIDGPYESQSFASPSSGPTRNGTGITNASVTSDVPRNTPISPLDEKPELTPTNGEGSNGSYYKGDQAQPQSEFTTEKKVPRWRKMLGKGPKDDEGPQRTNTDESKKKKHFGLWPQVKVVIFGSWFNVLLICVPVGIALHNAGVNPYASFAVNFLAIMPLAGILSFATEELSLRVGETLGGLLNASFGNAVELIVSVIALFHSPPEIVIVQTSLIGSILSNLLLVLGMCFFFGGFKRIEQFFNTTVAQTSSSLLALAIGTIIIPTTFKRFGTGGTLQQRQDAIPALSRGLAVMLLLVYICYLIFQLKSHSAMFSETGGEGTKRPVKEQTEKTTGVRARFGKAFGHNQAAHAGGPPQDIVKGNTEQTEEEEKEEPRLSVIGAVVTLCVSTAFIGVTSEYMVDGVAPMAQKISPEFIGLILIPIVGNAAEHVTAVTVAIKDKMDLAIGVAVGSSMQIALLVLPLIVIIGWFANIDAMTLEFDGFLLVVVFVSVLLVNYLIGDGRSHWLEGVMLLALYIIIATAAYLYPADPSEVVG